MSTMNAETRDDVILWKRESTFRTWTQDGNTLFSILIENRSLTFRTRFIHDWQIKMNSSYMQECFIQTLSQRKNQVPTLEQKGQEKLRGRHQVYDSYGSQMSKRSHSMSSASSSMYIFGQIRIDWKNWTANYWRCLNWFGVFDDERMSKWSWVNWSNPGWLAVWTIRTNGYRGKASVALFILIHRHSHNTPGTTAHGLFTYMG